MKKIILIAAVLLTPTFIMTPVLAEQTKDGKGSSRKQAQTLVDQGLALSNNSLEEAKFYLRAIEIDPTYANAYFNLGFVYHSRGELENAIAAYEKCLRLDPERHSAHNNLAMCLLAVRKDASLYEARHHLNQAIEIQETLPPSKQEPDLREQKNMLIELEKRINLILEPKIEESYSEAEIVGVLRRRITRGGQGIYEGPRLPILIFDTGSFELKPENKPQLHALANALKSPELISDHFIIEGHADARGTTASNLDLSRRRAEAVRNWLIEEGKIKAERLSIMFFGEDHPIFPNTSSTNLRCNRRIEIVRGDSE